MDCSDDQYIYYYGYIYYYLRRNGVAIIVNKRVQNAVLGCNLKNDRMISISFQGKPFSTMVIQVYALTSKAEEAEVEQFYIDLQDLLELTPKNDVLFIIGDCKSRKSINIWSNKLIWPWSIEWSRAKANRVLPRECTGHSKYPLPTTQERTLHVDITYHQYWSQTDLFFAAKDGEALYSQQKQDWELTVVQIMNSLLPNSDLSWRE